MKRKELLVISFYLSKFNNDAVHNLGYKNFAEACSHIGGVLGYSPNSVKNRRDDFDPLFNHRAGWYKEELREDSLEVVEQFGHLEEESLRSIVQDILSNDVENNPMLILDGNSKTKNFGTRGITGKKAEDIFIRWYEQTHPSEVLLDTRDLGCGYDFEVRSTKNVYEVKGLSADNGGIYFTEKEWVVANQLHEKYNLVVVRNCMNGIPEISIYPNPGVKLSPKKQINHVIQVGWGVSSQDLMNFD